MQKVRDVMTRDVRVVGANDTIAQAAKQMRDGNFGMMPVSENDRMVGAISDRDIATRAVAEGLDANTAVREVMSDNIVWAYEDDLVSDAARVMGEHQIRRLPVLNKAKRLVGIVALADVAVAGADIAVAGDTLNEISQPA
jgi:CBS domain-containing protein